jgi:hypothetical protein
MTSRQERHAPPGTAPTDEDLKHEAELTRQELGDTVAELMYKADVKSRAREAAQRRLFTIRTRTQTLLATFRANPPLAAAGLASLAAATTALFLMRRR